MYEVDDDHPYDTVKPLPLPQVNSQGKVLPSLKQRTTNPSARPFALTQRKFITDNHSAAGEGMRAHST